MHFLERLPILFLDTKHMTIVMDWISHILRPLCCCTKMEYTTDFVVNKKCYKTAHNFSIFESLSHRFLIHVANQHCDGAWWPSLDEWNNFCFLKYIGNMIHTYRFYCNFLTFTKLMIKINPLTLIGLIINIMPFNVIEFWYLEFI